MNSRNTAVGFTLIEILVALTIFAVLATMTSYILFHAANVDTHIKSQSNALHQLEFTVTLLRRDSEQVTIRAVRANQGSTIPAFIGHSDWAEWTRGGYRNDNGLERRSTLKRVAYLCQRGILIRRTWPFLDTPDRRQFHDTHLLTQLKKCSFSYIDAQQNTTADWTQSEENSKEKHKDLPKAWMVELSTRDGKTLVLLLPLPVGLYA